MSFGSIGARHLRVVRALLPEADVAVLRRPEAAGDGPPEGADRVFGALEDAVAYAPEAAILANPAHLRPPVALALLRAGAHLLLEKPLAITRAAAAELLAEAATRERRVQVGYQLRFHPLLTAARRALRSGEIGAPLLARFEVGQYLPDWRRGADYRAGVSAQAALGGGALLELSHEIDLALWMLGPPRTATASIGRVGALEIDVEDYATILMERPGLSVCAHLDFLQRAPRRRVLLIGSEATIEADLIAQTGAVRGPDNVARALSGRTDSPDETYLRQFDAFCARAEPSYEPRYADAPAPCTLAEADAVMAVVDAAREAARVGRRQDLDLEEPQDLDLEEPQNLDLEEPKDAP